MPSRKHQSLTKLLSESPQLIPLLVRDVLGLDVPEDFELLPAPDTVKEAQYPEHAADGAVLLRQEGGVTREVFVIEVQLRPDEDKRLSWPWYVAGIRLRLRCPVTLVVLTDDEATAAWSAKPIDLGRGQMVLRPLVIGPSQIPRTLEMDRALAHPELAVLAVIAHGDEDGAELLGRAALAASVQLGTTDPIRANLYVDLVLAFLGEAARKALEDDMGVSTDQYISDFARRYVSQGRDEGRDEGRAKGHAEALLLVFESRGLAVSEQVRARVTECTDVEQLDAWLARAITAKDVDSVFEE